LYTRYSRIYTRDILINDVQIINVLRFECAKDSDHKGNELLGES